MAELDVIPAPFTNGTSLTPQVNIGTKCLVGIIFPATWTTAGLTFQASGDGGTTFGELLDETATAKAVSSVTGGAYTIVEVDPTKWRGINCLKVRSGTVGAPINQTGVTLQLLTRMVF